MAGLTYYVGFSGTEIAATMTLVEDGVSSVVTMPTGYYYLGTSDGTYLSYATALSAAMTAASTKGVTYTVAWSNATLLFTITRTAGTAATVTITINAATQALLGFATGVTIPITASVATATARAYYVIRPALSAISNMSRDYEPDGVAFDDECDDGTSTGIARTSAPLYSDWSQLYETRAAVYSIDAAAAVPFTWQRFFAQARTTHPILVVRAADTDPTVTYDATDIFARVKLRAEGASFRPQPSANDDFDAYYHLPFRARVVERLSVWT